MPKLVPVNFASNLDTSENKSTTRNDQCLIKSEFNNADKLVIHRKSERRRVARDIFLVFEEQSCRRHDRDGKTKKIPVKPKFGHLKVGNPSTISRAKVRGLLRDIKNEPKCYLNPNAINNASRTIFKKKKVAEIGCTNSTRKKRVPLVKESPASVNPIFLWTKQEDTRIIEVRCEDYDKRNRIRLTKTTTGWRAIPRSDASTSRIAKLFQTPSLIKLKRDFYDKKLLVETSIDMSDNEFIAKTTPNSLANTSKPLATEKNDNFDDDKTTKNILTANIFKQDRKAYNEAKDVDDCRCEVICHSNKFGQQNSQDFPQNIEEIKNSSKNEKSNVLTSSFISSDTYQFYTPELDLFPQARLSLSANCQKIHINENEHGGTIHNHNTDSHLDDILQNFNEDSRSLQDLFDNANLLQQCVGSVRESTELISSLVKNNQNNFISQEENYLVSSQKDLLDDELVLQKIKGSSDKQEKFLPFEEREKTYEFKESGIQHSELEQTESLPLVNTTSNLKTGMSAMEIMPNDLSLKASEAMSASHGSNSQCAVTSTSDILQSTVYNEMPIVTGETIKNLIFDQIIGLNALNTLPKITDSKQKLEITNGNKQSNESVSCSEPTQPSFVETVLTNDKKCNEPVKKKACNSVDKKLTVTIPIPSVPLVIDGDPDPLTQLQLLIRNTQWKVPDPILVPKDRLGAVLASPAREIPLLITTRPELRLPEALAYPHIIQNPNILVISLAQLEEILRNHLETESNELKKNTEDEFYIKRLNTASKSFFKDMNTKCSFDENDSLTTNINTATLAVINQMLWLPYISQCSQEVFDGVQSPLSNFLSPYNSIPIGFQHLDNLYKNYIKQISNLKLQQNGTETTLESAPIYMGAVEALKNQINLMVIEKLNHQQYQNFENSDQLSTLIPSNDRSTPPFLKKTFSTIQGEHLSIEPQKFQQLNSKKKCTTDYTENSVSYQPRLNDHKDAIMFPQIHQKQSSKSAPRLTCKSLSNLLKPKNRASTSMCIGTFENQANLNLGSYQKDRYRPATNLNTSATICHQTNSNFVEIEKQCHGSWSNFTQPYITPKKNLNLLHTKDNSPLTHSLFSRNEFDSQWKWTTVTTAGE